MLSADGTHSSVLWAHAGRAPSAASMTIATKTRCMVPPPLPRDRRRLKGAPDAETEEAHLIQRDRRDLAEQRAGRVQLRTVPLLAVEEILRVDAHLPRAAAASA